MPKPSISVKPLTGPLLAWYDENARELAWRIAPALSKSGIKADPYHVWLSEIMAQQTQLVTVAKYFEKFIQLWPKLEDLANADLEQLLAVWAGLGYYSRARNLKKCADLVWSQYDGKFPETSAELIKLPGIGTYTAAAIAAISFGESVAVVDGNVERVICRLYAISTPLSKAKPSIRQLTQHSVPAKRPGDFAQAMMDLGATICTPKNPKCGSCPLSKLCEAKKLNYQENYPVKAKRKPVPTRRGAGFVAFNEKNEIYLRKRPDNGMLAQMSEIPTTDWSANRDGDIGVSAAPFDGNWLKVGIVNHTFTHFKLALEIFSCTTNAVGNKNGWWASMDYLEDEALPTLIKKSIKLAVEKRNTE